jgi:phosphoribosylglycinamide formyltransferase-1
MRVAVLASGGGSNLQALIDEANGDYEVVLVASDRQDAGALERARTAQIPAELIPEPSNGLELASQLGGHEPDLIVLAGYLKLVPPEVIDRFSNRIINIHPALLPSFGGKGMYGRRVHRAVIDSGVNLSGATVHLVNEEFDRGTILAQWPVPVMAGDTPDDLARRVLAVEHLILPEVVRMAAKHGGPVPLRPPGESFISGDAPGLHFTES